MPIYVDDSVSPQGPGLNQPLDNFGSGFFESAGAAFNEGVDAGPLNAAMRYLSADYDANDPTSPMVDKATAQQKISDLGITSVKIPDQGVTQAYLDHLTREKQDSIQQQRILSGAPSGFFSTPLIFSASLAGAMTDPGNIALGLIPVVGEARAASLAGRTLQRFGQGAALGAAQSLATEPFNAMASAAEGDDYTLGQAVENFFLNATAGGVLHAGGAAIRDVIQARRLAAAAPETNAPLGSSAPAQPDANISNGLINSSDVRAVVPGRSARDDFAAAINDSVDNYAWQRAYDQNAPIFQAELQQRLTGFANAVPDIRRSITQNESEIAALDSQYRDLARQYQGQRMTRKQAEAAARRDIAARRQELESSNEQLRQQVTDNATAERARGDLAAMQRGEIPDELAARIATSADQIRNGMRVTPLAAGVQSAADRFATSHWSVRQNALRAGLAQMMNGRAPDVEDIFALANPQTQQAAMERLKKMAVAPRNEPESMAASREADVQLARATRDDAELKNAQEDLNAEIELAQAHLDGVDAPPELRQQLSEIASAADDQSIVKGLRAYAACMLRRG